MTERILLIAVTCGLAAGLVSGPPRMSAAAPARHGSCFLLVEIGVGEIRRNPSATCAVRVSPQSTFKIPHALAALDAGVVSPDEVLRYDGHTVDFDAWRADHTLSTAMRFSVLWYFQEMARRLGADRERTYLDRLNYGNRDSSSGLTTFWLGGSLAISPEEQVRFLEDLYASRLPLEPRAMQTVRSVLVQPRGAVVNALGTHPFGAPWPDDVELSAKTGSGPAGGPSVVRWLVGHVRRGSRSWVFASNVVGGADTGALAAVAQAEKALVAEHVIR